MPLFGSRMNQIIDILRGDDKNFASPAVESVSQASDKVGKLADTLERYAKPALYGIGGGVALMGAGKLYKDMQKAKSHKAERDYHDYMLESQKFNDRMRHAPNQPLEKVAFNFKKLNPKTWHPDTRKALTQSAIAATIPAAIGGAFSLSNKLKNKLDRSGDKEFQKFIEKYPEYSNDPQVREFFDVMKDLNPSMTKHPLMVKSFMDESYSATEGNRVPSTHMQTHANTASKLQTLGKDQVRAEKEMAKNISQQALGLYQHFTTAQQEHAAQQLEAERQRQNEFNRLTTDQKYKDPHTGKIHTGYHPSMAAHAMRGVDPLLTHNFSPAHIARMIADGEDVAILNRQAVRKAYKAGAINKATFKDALKRIRAEVPTRARKNVSFMGNKNPNQYPNSAKSINNKKP